MAHYKLWYTKPNSFEFLSIISYYWPLIVQEMVFLHRFFNLWILLDFLWCSWRNQVVVDFKVLNFELAGFKGFRLRYFRQLRLSSSLYIVWIQKKVDLHMYFSYNSDVSLLQQLSVNWIFESTMLKIILCMV